MADPIPEGDLDFTCDSSWVCFRPWDRQNRVYDALQSQVPGSKAVDFIGVHGSPASLYLIEVKDYRASEGRSTTRKKLADRGENLAEIVAAKVRDTVAGLVGAARADRDLDWQRARDALTQKIFVVLWIEHARLNDDRSTRGKREQISAGILAESIRKRCRWLSAKVIVCSRTGQCLPGLTVQSKAQAKRMPGRRA